MICLSRDRVIEQRVKLLDIWRYLFVEENVLSWKGAYVWIWVTTENHNNWAFICLRGGHTHGIRSVYLTLYFIYFWNKEIIRNYVKIKNHGAEWHRPCQNPNHETERRKRILRFERYFCCIKARFFCFCSPMANRRLRYWLYQSLSSARSGLCLTWTFVRARKHLKIIL